MTIGDDFERMRTAMEEALGETLDTEHPVRTESQFWMRAIFAHFLCAHGWDDERIAALLGRGRSTVWYGRQRIRQAMDLPRVYRDVIGKINRFKSQYYELYGQNL